MKESVPERTQSDEPATATSVLWGTCRVLSLVRAGENEYLRRCAIQTSCDSNLIFRHAIRLRWVGDRYISGAAGRRNNQNETKRNKINIASSFMMMSSSRELTTVHLVPLCVFVCRLRGPCVSGWSASARFRSSSAPRCTHPPSTWHPSRMAPPCCAGACSSPTPRP